MAPKLSRRTFLKTSVVTAGSLVASCTLITGDSQVNASETSADNIQEPLVTLIDISKCVGCESCVEACRDVNQDQFPDPVKPFPKMVPSRVPIEDWSDKTDVTDRLTPYNWLFIQHAQILLDGEPVELNIPRRCMHCDNPPCVKLCPWGALKQEKNGLSRIDPDLCLGGSKCKKVCPWDIPQRQTGVGLYLDILPAFAGNGVMYKCNRCYQRLGKGQLPACIEVCPENVQTIGPKKQILEQAHGLAQQMNGFIYGETENGGTNTIYVSPVPFDQLNQKIDKSKGKPHFQKVKNMMADGTMLAKAMIIAPFAGLFAAFGKHYLASREDRE